MAVNDNSTVEVEQDIRDDYPSEFWEDAQRGRYRQRVEGGTNVVKLDDDVFEAFQDSTAVNEALRTLLRVRQLVSKSEAPLTADGATAAAA